MDRVVVGCRIHSNSVHQDMTGGLIIQGNKLTLELSVNFLTEIWFHASTQYVGWKQTPKLK